MNVTSKGRYALRVMLDLARHREDGYISLKTIAERTDCSMKYLEMIVSHLKKARLVDSTRGKDGGYKLCRGLEDYTVGEILRCSIIEKNIGYVYKIEIDYADIDKFKYFAKKNNIIVLKEEYLENAILEVALKEKNVLENIEINMKKMEFIKKVYV